MQVSVTQCQIETKVSIATIIISNSSPIEGHKGIQHLRALGSEQGVGLLKLNYEGLLGMVYN